MNRILKYSSIVLFAAFSGLAGYSYQHNKGPAITVLTDDMPMNEQSEEIDLVGMSRPDFSLQDVDGHLRHISEWDGKVVTLNFWATWCPPCLKEIPEFVHLQSKYEGRGLQLIGIALQRPEEVVEFMQEHKMNYPVLAGEMEVVNLSKVYGNTVGALPYTVIIDRNGHIAFVKYGQLSGEDAEKVISKLL